jgi:hypothetical protein
VVVVFSFYFYQMPGPSNSNVKRKRKSRGKDNKSQNVLPIPAQPRKSHESTTAQEPPTDFKSTNLPSLPPPPPYLRPPSPLPYQFQNSKERLFSLGDHVPSTVEEVMLKQPFIYDPGNGPRVRIAKEFISSFFAQPPAYDVSTLLVLIIIIVVVENRCERLK